MDQRIEFAVSLVDDDFSLPLDLRRVAERVNLSISRLRHLVKEEKGFSLQRYQKALRMEKARNLLIKTFLSIKEIKIAVGINSDSHFASDFKRSFGLTPTEYRVAGKSSADYGNK